MKLGLITDVHEHADNLRRALFRFEQEQVDQIVFLGDVFSTGPQLDETCQLLAKANVRGVWGNHDFGLCTDPPQLAREQFTPATLEYCSQLRPTLTIEDCHFSHVEPWLDPTSLFDLWYYDGPPNEHGKLWRIFHSQPQRLLFAGHFHKWLLATPEEILPWQGEGPVTLGPGRFFCVIGALCDGHFATLDISTSELKPLRA